MQHNRPESNNGTLNRSETKTMLRGWLDPNSPFFKLPPELIQKINGSLIAAVVASCRFCMRDN